MDISYLEKSIKLARQAIEATPINDEHWLKRMRALADLEEVIQLSQRILDMLDIILILKFGEKGNMADLDKTVSAMQEIIDTIPQNHPHHLEFSSILQTLLYNKFSYTREMADNEEAICLGQDLINATPLNHLERAMRLISLAQGFYNRYSITKDTGDLNEAISLSQEARDTVPQTGQIEVACLHARLLSAIYDDSRDIAYLEEAIYVVFKAVGDYPTNEQLLNKALESLQRLFSTRYSCTKALADVDAAIIILQTAIAALPNHIPARDRMLGDLGIHLHNRYKHTYAAADLDEAISTFRDALNSVSLNDKTRFHLSIDLSTCLSERYSRTGVHLDIEESICILRETIGSTGMNNLERAFVLNVLGCCLYLRHESTGAFRDLDEAICISQDSLAILSPDNETRVNQLHNLGNYLFKRYSRTGAMSDIEEAILVSREAIGLMPPDFRDQARILSGLTGRLIQRYGRTKDIEDLNEAIRLSQESLEAKTLNGPGRATLLNGLGSHLDKKFGFTRKKSYLDEAILLSQEAIEITPLNHPVRAHFLTHLGTFLERRSAESGDFQAEAEAKKSADIKRAQKCFLDALYHEPAERKDRFVAGRRVLTSYDFINNPQAYDVAKYTVDLIPLLASRSLRNSDKQNILSDIVGVSSTAAAIALHTLPANQRSFAAIEALLEQHDVSTLRNHYPDLAVSFLALRDRLDRPDIPDTLNAFNVAATNIEIEENERHKTEKEFTHLLETIRSKPDFERFILPASEADMVKAAYGGPIVIINLSLRPRRCDALIISQSGLRALELLDLSEGMVSDLLLAQRLHRVESLETLAWLWDVIVCPVLDALGFTETPSDESWPHVWWILTGILSNKLPLHAAGHHLRRSGETTLDRVVSSYATSVKSIIHNRQRGAPSFLEPLKFVAVAMEQTDGNIELIHAGREIDAISNILESKAINYIRPQPYKYDVLSAIKTCQIFHFAGHGETHPTDPLRSTLLLKDWQNEPLTVESLLETDLSSNQPFLAYLSACGTGRIIHDGLLDESIHLANAFQLAGFRHVIGTLWSVDDEICVKIAKMIYKALRDKMEDGSVSRGLHDAVRTLRDQWVDMADGGSGNENLAVDGMREGRHAQLDNDEQVGPPLWIPYVHFGV
ncbi:CHAT domain-containing protein [Trichoderma sp. SZMC 28011]